jgi:ankyrin repeat protein
MDAATVLVWAAFNGHIEIVKSLIAKGVDVNARDRDGRGNSALICAIWSVDVPMVRLLIRNGADANTGNSNWTPVMTAAWAMGSLRRQSKKNVLPILKLLLAKGAKVNARDRAGQTALSLAAAVGDVAALRVLLRAGAYIHIRDRKGNGALMGAVQHHNSETIKFLLEQGINANARNKEGKTVLAYAEECEADEIVQLLVQHGARK